jgi:hypothetical protein
LTTGKSNVTLTPPANNMRTTTRARADKSPLIPRMAASSTSPLIGSPTPFGEALLIGDVQFRKLGGDAHTAAPTTALLQHCVPRDGLGLSFENDLSSYTTDNSTHNVDSNTKATAVVGAPFLFDTPSPDDAVLNARNGVGGTVLVFEQEFAHEDCHWDSQCCLG